MSFDNTNTPSCSDQLKPFQTPFPGPGFMGFNMNMQNPMFMTPQPDYSMFPPHMMNLMSNGQMFTPDDRKDITAPSTSDDSLDTVQTPSSADFNESSVGPIRNSFRWTEKSQKDCLEKFDEVPGRLCLLSGSTKFKVTVGEVMRRMLPPETLHASLINGILRKAKAKDNGKRLREALSIHQIELPSGRRKTAQTTGFTAFCEAEAIKLAKEWNNLCQREGGAAQIGQQINSMAVNEGRHQTELARDLEGFRNVLDRIGRVYKEVNEDPEYIKPRNAAEEAINKFSLLTHGFGHNAMRGVFTHLNNIANEATTQLHQQQQQQQQMLLMSHMVPSAPAGFYPPQQ